MSKDTIEEKVENRLNKGFDHIKPLKLPHRKRVYIPQFQLAKDGSIAGCLVEQTDVKTGMIKKVFMLKTEDIAMAISQYTRFNSGKIKSKKVKGEVKSHLFNK